MKNWIKKFFRELNISEKLYVYKDLVYTNSRAIVKVYKNFLKETIITA
jgi:hypothetical protein